MEDIIFTVIVLALGGGIQLAVQRVFEEPFEQRRMAVGYATHVAAGWVLYAVYKFYYGMGDMFAYYISGVPLANALSNDWSRFSPEILSLFLQQRHHLPDGQFTIGATGSMEAVTVVLLFLLGNSMLAAVTAISTAAFLAKVAMYRALKPEFATRLHPTVLTALMFSPSGLVWSCALLKEPIAVAFTAPFFLGLRWFLDGRRLWLSVPLLLIGAGGAGLVKPYVMLTLVLSAAVWVAWARVIKGGSVFTKPVYLLAAAGVATVGLAGASTIFPSLSVDRVGESMTKQRRAAAHAEGDSNFYLEEQSTSVDEERNLSLGSQVALMPIALVTALFRPFLFEARKAMQLANALEMTWIVVLFAQMLRNNGARTTITRIMNSPALMFCAAFTLSLAFGTGLATANLGALSRYRAPMMPFYLLLLLILREKEVNSQTEQASPASPQEPRPASLPV